MYNMTLLKSSKTMSDLFNYANTSTSGVLGGLLVLALFFVILMSLRRGNYDFEDSLLSASFVCFIVSAILASVGLLSLYFAIAFLIILALTGLYTSIVPKQY